MNGRNSFRKALSLVLTVCMIITFMPTTAFATETDTATAEQEAIRQTLFESVAAEEYPQGMFDFLTPRMQTSEDVGKAEFAIVRRGNTDAAASVTLKIIDMTAEYGKDYVIEVPGLIFDHKLKDNPEAETILEESVHVVGDEAEAATEAAIDAEADVATEETVDAEPANKATTSHNLRSARTALTGMASNSTNWREADEAEIEAFSDAYNEMYDAVEGIEYVLNFEPGENMKTLKFVTINDNISEDEEQVLFVLCHPENCAVSDNPTGFMNIVDDEAPEALSYGFTAKYVEVAPESFKAELTVERLSGLYRYGAVEVFSAEDTAVEGVHYNGFADELAFVPGQQYQKVEIPIKSHPALEDVRLKVYLGDYDDYAYVVIKGENANRSEATVLQSTAPLRSMATPLFATNSLNSVGEMSLMGVNDSIWCRKEKVRPSVAYVAAGTYFETYKNNSNYWVIDVHDYNKDSNISFKLDLTMVKNLQVKSEEYSNGTYYDDTWWFLWEHGSSGYHTDMCNYVNVNGTRRTSHTGRYSSITDTIELSDADRKVGTVTFGTSVSNKCCNALGAFCKDIELNYIPVEIKIGSTDADAMIQPKIYTSQNTSTNNGNAFLAGNIKFAGVTTSSGITSKFFYNNDIVTLEETARVEPKRTYLWGIKFETQTGSRKNFFYYEGTSFNIKDLYTGKLKDVDGCTIDSTAKLTDSINGEIFTCYHIYPVYKQKTAYTTIKMDSAKSQFATGTYKNEATVKTGMMDKLQINLAGKNGWAVSGFRLSCSNSGDCAETSAAQERWLYKGTPATGNDTYKTWSPIYKADSIWKVSLVNADASDPGSFLFYPNVTHNSLEALYQKPEITVAVNPKAQNVTDQTKGYVAYINTSGAAQTAKYKEVDSKKLLTGDEIKVAPYKAGDTYQFIGQFNNPSETGYKFQWQDFTGDIDRDGVLTYEELKALGNSYGWINTGTYAGDILSYTPMFMGSPILYYNIIPKPQNESGTFNSLSGRVYMRGCSIIENSKSGPNYTETPVSQVSIAAGGKSTFTDSEGKWEVTSAAFAVGEIYTATASYKGRSYTGDVTVNRFATNFMIDEYNTFNVKNFKAYRVENLSETINKEEWKLYSIQNGDITNEDKRHLYTFEIEELMPTTAIVGRVEVNRYSSSGTLKATYSAIYNENSREYEIKDTTLLASYLPGPRDPESYMYSFNPATETVAAGDYLTVRVYDTNGVGYIEHNVGFIYKPKLSIINIINTFKSPLNPVIDYIGKVDTNYDLGVVAYLDDFIAGKAGSIINTDDERIISFGWDKDFKESYDSSKSKDDKKHPESTTAPATAAEIIGDAARSLDGLTIEPGQESEEVTEAENLAEEAVDTDSKENKKHGKVTGEFKINLSVALELVMGYDSKENRFYFKDLVVTGVAKGNSEAKYEYGTPVGLVIFVKGTLSGNITALMEIEPYYQNPANPEYLYMDETGTVDLTTIGTSDVNRKLSFYGKLMVRPKITLSAGTALWSDKVATAELEGAAVFDMIFTSGKNGSGNVTLSADLVINVLNGLVKKRWSIANQTYEMFSYGNSLLGSLMSVEDDYRYDYIMDSDTDEMLYLQNRTGWNNNRMLLLSNGIRSCNETVLQTGVYPYASPQLFMLDEDSEDQLLLFLDYHNGKICLMYSLYQGSWTQPAQVDENTVGDDTPCVDDLGDKLFITWSSQGSGAANDPLSKLNSRDIKGVFFDKATKTFSEIQYVTKTTAEDVSADDFASASYYKAGDAEELMVTYIKTEYSKTGDELAVGDLLDAYSTIAYRFYDFEEEKWIDSYSDDDELKLKATMDDAEFEQYEANWYGQGFVDLAHYATVDDSELMSEDYPGCWDDELDTGIADIQIKTLDSDPRVVEHETINCAQYAVSAYLVDMNKSLASIDDRDIFLQLYDFSKDVFYPAIRLTNDDHYQSNLEFVKAPNGVNLYYISDGDIVKQNISELVNNLIGVEVNGEKVLLQNKFYRCYSGETVILKSEEDNPYSEYIVNTDGESVYLTWTEKGISVKDGIDINSSEATLPENYYSENQMYMAMETITPIYHQLKDEEENDRVYSAMDISGNAIDWNVTPDINGNIGLVSVDDPVIRIEYASSWTEPVQLTDEQGANFSNIDCAMLGDGYLRCIYLKGMSEVNEVAGIMMPTENTDNRSLISADFNLNLEEFDISIDNAEEVKAGTEAMPISITVKNESLLTRDDILVSLSMSSGGEQTLVSEAAIDEMTGGAGKTVNIFWDVPESLDDVALTATVKCGGVEYGRTSEEFFYDGLIEIAETSYELINRNTAEFSVVVQNTGSENATGERVYINCGGVVSKSEAFDLAAGNMALVVLTAAIPESAFEESRTATQIIEAAPLKVYTTGSIVEDAIVRTADVSLEAMLDGLDGMVDLNGKAYSNSISFGLGEMMMLEAARDGNAADDIAVTVESDNAAVLSVVNGVLTGERSGRTKLSVNMYPYVDTYRTGDEENMRRVSNYLTLPSALIHTEEVVAVVGGGSGGGGGTAIVPADSATETIKPNTETVENGVAKVALEEGNLADAVKKAADNKIDTLVIAPEVKGNASEVIVDLPTASVKQLANSSNATLVVKTAQGSVQVPNDALGEIAGQSKGSDIEVIISEKSMDDAGIKNAMEELLDAGMDTKNAVAAEVTISSENEKITKFGGKKISVNLPLDGKSGYAEGGKYLVLVISENGKRELMAGTCYKGTDGKLSTGVNVGHLSTFVVLNQKLASFNDATAHWAADAIDYAVANGLMNGVSDTTFAPNATLNRAMLVTILYRLAGSPEVSADNQFKDVESGQWYSDAVAWAADCGIVTGKTKNSFAPMESITREQLAAMLMRYCKYQGGDVSAAGNLSTFADKSSISDYAVEALTWANAAGIITGRTADTIAPAGKATRAETAVILMRFMQL